MNRSILLAISVVVSLAMVAVALLWAKPLLVSDVTASYEVQGDSIVLLEGEPEPWHAAAWERWVELVPESARWRVARFDAIAGSSEGQVEPISDNLQVWTLRIAELDDRLRDVALIHELGHLVSLGPSEVVPATDPSVEDECVTYFSVEGCAIPGSLFDRFVTTFWAEEDRAPSEQSALQRYRLNSEAYVSGYAATNPGEDIAETFVFFVYRLRPTGTTIADEKIALFWEFPELVELRLWLRRGLSGYLTGSPGSSPSQR
ncbi:MAG: hypothetical protein HKN80_13480 [Acidimicrobiia bacterium]|nr:hypothetical protein [Acidimicrobiia bacterium]